MDAYLLHREQMIRRPLEEVFAFFADATNLELLTPPWVHFRILTPRPIKMHSDAIIHYLIRWRGLPFPWRTRILLWRPPHIFIDVQETGPYRIWHHTHRFEPTAEGTRITDTVRYAPPLGPLGGLMNALWIRRDVEAIFDYRHRRIEEVFADSAAGCPEEIGIPAKKL
ncbi:MAG: SRPBCC family protein [Phycisphaerales bacterium]|nr:SRPBCC family protein [Phycisphaerales bacterium]